MSKVISTSHFLICNNIKAFRVLMIMTFCECHTNYRIKLSSEAISIHIPACSPAQCGRYGRQGPVQFHPDARNRLQCNEGISMSSAFSLYVSVNFRKCEGAKRIGLTQSIRTLKSLKPNPGVCGNKLN